MTWIVMTSAARMPSSCRGRYRNVALVKLSPDYVARQLLPKMISEHARGVEQIEHFGHHSVELTDACAYRRALKRAEARAAELNAREGSWRPELTDGSGWAPNGYRYATEAEAKANADLTFSRWLGAKDKRVVYCTDAVNAVWDFDRGEPRRLEVGAA